MSAKPQGTVVAVTAHGESSSRPVDEKGQSAVNASKIAAWVILPVTGALLGLQLANGQSSRNEAVARAAAPLAGSVLLAAIYARMAGQKKKQRNTRPKPVEVKTWVGRPDGSLPFPEIDDPDFAVAALNDKAPLAICISGGGVRATTLGLGWLRGLHELGVLQRAKYLCTTSGASWLNGAFSFQTVTDSGEFLGPYLAPEKLTLKQLAQVGDPHRCYPGAVANAVPLVKYLKDLLEKASKFERDQSRGSPALELIKLGINLTVNLTLKIIKRLKPGADARSWTKAMTDSFLVPFGLGDTNHSTVTVKGTKVSRDLEERAEQAARGIIYTTDPTKVPFPIMTQVILQPGNTKYYPFEWTPLYGGCPVSYDTTKPKLGAGWVEILGLNAKLLEQPKQPLPAGGSGSVRVKAAGPGSLGEAIGVSSAFGSMTAGFQNMHVMGRLMHKFLGWHTAKYFDPTGWQKGELELTDGGGTDLFAIFPALRRRVPNIMVFAATTAEIKDYDKFYAEMRDLALLFGVWKETTDEVPLNGQVFPNSGFRELFEALRAKVAAGKPPVHVAEYEVLENREQGVQGGWRARVMWVINERQPAWEAALPAETRKKLEADRSAVVPKPSDKAPAAVAQALQLYNDNRRGETVFFDFPLVSTFYSNYSPEMVNMLSNHAAWMVVESKDLVSTMLGSPAKVQPQQQQPVRATVM